MKTIVQRILCLLIVAVLFLSPTVARAVPTLAPNHQITSVPVWGGPPVTMAYDSGKGEIFAQYNTISGTAMVAVISDSTNNVVTNITEAQGAARGFIGDVVYDSGRGEIFAASGSQATSSIAVISDSNNSIVTTISYASPGNSAYDWPYQPVGMVYDSGKGEIFVSDIHDGAVYVISDQSNAVVANIGVETNAGEMVYDSAKGEVFVANSYQVSVISDTTNTIVANVSVLGTGLAYDQAKGEVFAIGGSAISIISDSTNAVVATISGVSGASSSMAYDPAKGEIFAGPVISDSTNTIVAQLPTGIQNIVYDSGKGEIVATYVPEYYSQGPGIDLFSDSGSITTTTSTSSTSSTNSITGTSTSPTGSHTSSSTASSTVSTGGSSSVAYPLGYLAVLAVVAVVLAGVVLASKKTPTSFLRNPGPSLRRAL